MSTGAFFRVTINLGNAEMLDGSHVAEALRGVANRVDHLPELTESAGQLVGRIFDLNGNTVGTWEVAD